MDVKCKVFCIADLHVKQLFFFKIKTRGIIRETCKVKKIGQSSSFRLKIREV